MSNIKAEVLANIIANANSAKSIEGKPNVYSPDEYNKIATQHRALGLIQNTEYLESHIQPGTVEFDPNTKMLKKIARNEPKMLDLNAYTANRYYKETVLPINAKKVGREAGDYIVMVLGNAIVQAINNTQELPPTVKAYRFKRVKRDIFVNKDGETPVEVNIDEITDENVEQKAEEVSDKSNLEKKTVTEWVYCGAEFIKDQLAYGMTKQLSPNAVLKLRAQIDENPNPRMGNNVYGDDLDDIE